MKAAEGDAGTVELVAGLGEVESWRCSVPNEPHLVLRVRHVRSEKPSSKGAVLLLHGANSGSDTFFLPNGGLSGYLRDAGWDVWLLDWRGSPYSMKLLLEADVKEPEAIIEERRRFTYERVADVDLPLAIDFMRTKLCPDRPISVVGHCVCGGVTSMAIARRKLEGVRNIVLVAMGLFYEVPWDGWIKVEDFILERVLASEKPCRAIDPHDPTGWPEALIDAWEKWPEAWLREGGSELFKRILFMFGQPWTPELLHEDIGASDLKKVFGPMHLGLYLHSGQMVRRGIAGDFDELDVVDRARIAGRVRDLRPQRDYLDPAPFRDKVITLITGAENRVWHRDSIDLMYDWLRNIGAPEPNRYEKHVLPGYGLQDLFWHAKADEDVYPKIERGLGRVPVAPGAAPGAPNAAA